MTFQQEVQSRVTARLGELTAQNIELGAAMDAMTQQIGAVQPLLDGFTAMLAWMALTGQL